MARARERQEPSAHQCFVGERRIVRGIWEKVRSIGADFDSFGEKAEDDEFRLRGGMSSAMRDISRGNPSEQIDQEMELILLEEAGEEGVSYDYLEEFLDEKRNA